MAYIITSRNILSAIVSAPHSVSERQILEACPQYASEVISSYIDEFLEAGLIKENSERHGTYFTRRPHRDAINSFLSGRTDTLPGIEFQPIPSEHSAATQQLTVSNDVIDDVLHSIVEAPHAICASEVDTNATQCEVLEAINKLIDKDLIKEHARKHGYYFTNPDHRDRINQAMNGDITIAELMGETGHTPEVTIAAIPEEDWVPTPDCCECYHAPTTEAPVLANTTSVQDFDLLMAAMLTVRDIANAFVTKYQR